MHRRWPLPILTAILAVILGLSAPRGLVTPSLLAQETVDFVRDIEPILSQHCWKCHGEQRAAGGLRLDQRTFAERGGGSGKNLLTLSRQNNELLRRVRSTVDGERMPIEGMPLSAAEIATLDRWIGQGATWPNRPKPKATEANPHLYRTEQTSYEQLLDRWEYVASAPFRPVYITMIGFLVVLLIVERVKKTKATKPRPKPGWLLRHTARISRAWYLVGILVLVCCWLVQFARDVVSQSRSRSLVQTRGDGHDGGNYVQKEQAGMNSPFRPQHPPRLGGTYYRGNDERSEDLFNGGFYRTATFHVRLADEQGNDLAWGDPVPARPHIRFEISRSPHASPTLFAPGIMDHVGLSPVQPEQRESAKEIPFTLLKADTPGERWSILYPLDPLPTQGRLTGKLYLYKGNPSDATHRTAEASYLIGYELLAEEGQISRQSQIWMASVYNVSSLQWPQPGQIPADQWFDFRPIPEIEQPAP